MKIMTKVLTLIVIVFSISILASCHGTNDEITKFEIPEEFDINKEYNISFWSKNDTNIVQKQTYEKAIQDFNKYYPNIHVTMKSYTNYDDIRRDVLKNIATRTYPNICITYPDHVAEYMSGNNIVVDLNELIDNPKFGLGGEEVLFDAPKKSEMIQKYMDECLVGDAYYGIPFMRSTEALYINKTYLDSMGVVIPDSITWDWIWEISEKSINEKKSDSVLIPFIYKSTDNLFIQYLKQAGANYTDDHAKIYFDNPTARTFLKKVSEMAKIGAFRTFTQVSYPGNYFNQNQCIFAVDSTAGATWIGSNCPQKEIAEDAVVEVETVVRPVPQVDPSHPYMISQGPSLCLFNTKDSGEVLASWFFIQFLLSNEVQISYAQTEGYVPVTSKAYNDPNYIDYLSRSGENNDLYYDVKIAATKMLLENTNNTFVTSVFKGSAAVRSASSRLVEEVVTDVTTKEINEAYFDELYKKIINQKKLDLIEEVK